MLASSPKHESEGGGKRSDVDGLDNRFDRRAPICDLASDLSSFGLDSDSDWLNHVRRAECELPLGFMAGYALLAEIGRGAQGVVFKARQPGTDRIVAIKRLTAGVWAAPGARARFEREMRATASLDHPGVVTVYQCAFEDSQPVLVMEHVDGQPIDQWCQSTRRSVRDAVGLTARVCDPVAHAHQRGVIHRDLKPSNIIVDAAGNPHVLDFGLARLLHDESMAISRDGAFLGTPAYASPEQLAGDRQVDTRSDVYALGAILFNMITGRPLRDGRSPLGATLESARRVEAPRPSSIRAGIPADLDAIVGKALAIEPHERYASVDTLAADLRRFLAGEAVLAHPPSAMYQIRKFIARHRGMGVAIGAVLLVIVLGLVAVSLALVQTREAQHDTQLAQKTAEQVNAFLNEMLATADPEVMRGQDVPVSAMLDEAVKKLDAGALANEPESQAKLRSTIGEAYQSLGLYPQARTQFTAALELNEARHGDLHPDVARGLLKLSWLLSRDEEFDAAARLADRAVALRRALLGEDHELTIEALQARAMVWSARGERTNAIAMLSTLLPQAIRVTGGEQTDLVAQIKGNLGFLAHETDPATAIQWLEDTLATQRLIYGADDERTARTLINLGASLNIQGKPHDAEPLMIEALEMRRRLYGEDHPSYASALYNLANATRFTQGYAPAETMYRQVLAIRERALVPGHYDTARTRMRIGECLCTTQHCEEAERYLLQAIAEMTSKPGEMGERANQARRFLIQCRIDTGKFELAETVLFDLLHSVPQDQEPRRSQSIEIATNLFVRLYEAWGKADLAAQWRARSDASENEPSQTSLSEEKP